MDLVSNFGDVGLLNNGDSGLNFDESAAGDHLLLDVGDGLAFVGDDWGMD